MDDRETWINAEQIDLLEEIDLFIQNNIDVEKKRLDDYQTLNQISLSHEAGFPYSLVDITVFETYKELHLVYEANKDRMVERPQFTKKPKKFKKPRPNVNGPAIAIEVATPDNVVDKKIGGDEMAFEIYTI